MSAVVDTPRTRPRPRHDHHGGYSGLMRWITTTNHKDIGTLYLWFSFIMFMVGGVMALVDPRRSCSSPACRSSTRTSSTRSTTMHGLIMVFGAIMPAFVGFANWQIPMMIGAPDMAFARLNNWSFWLLPFAGVAADHLVLHAGRRPGRGLDAVRAAHGADGRRHGPDDLRRAPARHELDPRLDQHHHHHPQHARAGHDADAHAAVLLDLADHRLPAGRGDAGARGRGDHVAHRPALRHLASSTPRAAATRCSTSTSSGSSATPRSTSSRCPPSAWSRR